MDIAAAAAAAAAARNEQCRNTAYLQKHSFNILIINERKSMFPSS
jgi:hypothetical protein